MKIISHRVMLVACVLFAAGAAESAAQTATSPAGAGARSSALDTLAPMTWFEVPNSAVSTSGEMYQFPAGRHFGNSPHIRFFDESGASYDSLRNRMVVFGGGHGDYAGNEIMVFDIESLRWMRISDPSPRLDTAGAIERSGYYPGCRRQSRISSNRDLVIATGRRFIYRQSIAIARSAHPSPSPRGFRQNTSIATTSTRSSGRKRQTHRMRADFSQPRSIHRRIVCGY